ncbi:unnamed protein product [Rotaria magnacalcarata]|uniref:Uncharacterized protein n=1 Tax=Rotaria magnacalcarata TaxID=392030 RepID=A0A816FB49_9BILA|nr:unnamed protein product [Rotaria magnacalcarata]CAF4184934.1 unnamed protein product [Rotaria magnacalcarata]
MQGISTILLSCLLSLPFLVQLRPYFPNIKQVSQSMLEESMIENIRYNYGNQINIGFSDFELIQAKNREGELQQNYDFTAILLHWKRSDSTKIVVDYLLHSNLFKEIIIWNNNPQINLEKSLFQNYNHSLESIRIINSKENLKDEAKYRACAEAKTMACFYVDDDWDASFYLKSLIADFRADPYVLHSVTDPYTFYTNLMWTYFDSEINLHSGFSWIGCGSIFLREYAQRHLQYLQMYLKNNSIDNDPKTCWRPGRNVHRGEFFAIDFLYIRTNLSFSITIAHGQELQNSLDLNLSFDGVWWIAYRSLNGITIRHQNLTSNIEQYKIVFNSTEFNTGFHSFRYIAFNASKLSPWGEFQVCDVQTIAHTIPTHLQ